jgi:predicted ATPase/DNA-binding SARP family transcriptional activator
MLFVREWTMGAVDDRPRVRVDVLGPLRIVVEGVTVEVRGPKRRAVLALLALAEGRAVTIDHLVDALWPAEIPESGRQALHSHVSRLRGHLGPAAARLETLAGGYRLVLGSDDLDAAQARELLRKARASADRDPAGACALLRKANALWRGPVLGDLAEVAPVATAVVALEQLHRDVTDALIGCAIDAEALDEGIVGLAAAALAADPLREPAALLLMRALAATGRAPEALRIGREYRRRLADEAGLDPSPALGALERNIAGGAAGPAGRAPSRRSAVLTAPTTRLIGREAEVGELRRLIAAARLVTLVGPGGVGKTRVALEVARQVQAATVLLLAPVTDPAAIPHALAGALDLEVVQGDVLSACVAVLGGEPGLLVIDNCEHLLDAIRDTVEVVLAGCPELTVLATSREPLGLATERPWRLAPLSVPSLDPDGGPLDRVPSVAVFLDRAARARPAFCPESADLRTVAGIVRRLDGMPLAIELAAGRLSTFSLADLHDRLDRSLDLLGGGRPSGDARHRTLRSTIEWSYQLLTADERRLFAHLSVFVDGVDLATAERVAADLRLPGDPGSALARLVDASMIEATFDGRTRYRMLETLRMFGLDRLAAVGEGDAAAERMLQWAVELTTWAEATMTTEREPEADAVLRRELPNLRAAWRLARRQEAVDQAVSMVIALFDMVGYRDLVEMRVWVEELAADPALVTHPRAAGVLGVAAEVAYHCGDYARADRLARAGLEHATDAEGSWYCLMALSVAALARGAYAEVIEHSMAAAAVASRPRENLGIAALAAAYAGDLDRARELNDRMLAAAMSPTIRAFGYYVVGEIDSAAGRAELAEDYYIRAIDLARSSGATFIVGVATVGLLAVRAKTGRIYDALCGYRDVIDYFARTGNWTHQWATLRNLADLLYHLGDHDPAMQLHAAADQAPEAPAVNPLTSDSVAAPRVTPAANRARALEVARQAIERHLAVS